MADRAPFNTAQLVSIPAFNSTVPKMGPKCVPIFPDFTAAGSYLVDLTMMQQQNQIDSLQSIFIDNSGGNVPITLQVGITKQIVTLPPFSQGVLPLFIPNPPQFTVTSQGNTYAVQLICTNMPLPYMVWNSRQSTSNYSGSGAQTVSDAILEAGVIGGYYQSQQFAMSGLMNVTPVKQGTVPFFQSLTSAGTNATIITAVAAQGWYVNYLEVSLSSGATVAAAGDVIVQLREGTTVLMTKTVYVPAAATNVDKIVFSLNGQIALNAKAVNTTLNINTSTVLTAGAFNINVIGGRTTDVN